MGRRDPDRMQPIDWRSGYEHIGAMRAAGWKITSVCNRCHLNMVVDMRVLIFLLGERGVLWNRHPGCRRVGCEGRVTFWAQPPQCFSPFPMRAEWPVDRSTSETRPGL